MLAELRRTEVLAHPDRFDVDHWRALEAFESLRRHGFHGSRAGSSLGPFQSVVRWMVELVARYVVVSYLKSVATTMRNLYWMREMEAASDSRELKLLRPARFDATALCEIMRSREIGVPSFVIGLLIPLGATVWRLVTGFTFDRWWVAALVGIGGVAIGLGLSWSCSAAARSRRTGSSSRPGRRSRRSGRTSGTAAAAEGPLADVRGRRDLRHDRRLGRPLALVALALAT